MSFFAVRSHFPAGTGRIRRVAASVAVWSLCCLLASCGDAKIPLYPVTGTVKVGDQVPDGAQVVLHSQGQPLPDNLVPNGTVGPDGKFSIGTYDKTDGAPAGDYKVTVLWFKLVTGPGGSGAGPNVLPRSYADPKQTPLTVTVAAAPTELPPIVIKR